MSLLSLVQEVCDKAQLPRPTVVVADTSATVRLIRTLIKDTGEELLTHKWAQLETEHTVTLVTAQANYALPADFDSHIANTQWDQSQDWMLYGPVTPEEWRYLKESGATSSIRKRYRIKGIANNQLYIDPTPTSDENGQTLISEYQSNVWFRPRDWEASTVFAAGSHCFYNGYYFRTVAGGTSGASAPTPSSLNDGAVTWINYTTPYTTFLADTDEFILDEGLVKLGTEWRLLEKKGQPYAVPMEMYYSRLTMQDARMRGTRVVRFNHRANFGPQFVINVPETGYGS